MEFVDGHYYHGPRGRIKLRQELIFRGIYNDFALTQSILLIIFKYFPELAIVYNVYGYDYDPLLANVSHGAETRDLLDQSSRPLSRSPRCFHFSLDRSTPRFSWPT